MIAAKVGDFRNKLSSYLKKVRQGMEITITDRDTPIGRVVPIFPLSSPPDPLRLIEPEKGYAGLATFSFSRAVGKVSAVDELLAERRRR